MSTETITCSQCKRKRGKAAKPWRACSKCSAVMCLFCAPSCNATPTCSGCWRIEYDAKKKIEQETPVECQGCHNKVLPAEMKDYQQPPICKACHQIVSSYSEAETAYKRKKNARPGLVECVWGVVEPKEDGGKGYAYRDPGLGLGLGDIVLLPPTWVDEMNGKHTPEQATVVSTYSDYSGEVKTVRGLVRKAGDQ